MRLALACLAAGALLAGAAQAQNPSADQIVKSLTPVGASGTTRGIHAGPAPGALPRAAGGAPSVSMTVQFASGSATLTPQARQALDELGRALSTRTLAPYRFRIEGHTDTVGSRDYNKALSDRRAEAVAQYLTTTFHVSPERLEPIGMGEDGLLIQTPDQTPEPRNRRVEMVNIGG